MTLHLAIVWHADGSWHVPQMPADAEYVTRNAWESDRVQWFAVNVEVPPEISAPHTHYPFKGDTTPRLHRVLKAELQKVMQAEARYGKNDPAEGKIVGPFDFVDAVPDLPLTLHEPTTRARAIAKLVELDVAKWGESERRASLALRTQLSHGLALNALAYYDIDNVNHALAAEALVVMTEDDWRVLRDY